MHKTQLESARFLLCLSTQTPSQCIGPSEQHRTSPPEFMKCRRHMKCQLATATLRLKETRKAFISCSLGFQLGWHLLDLSVVVSLNVLELFRVIGSDKVNCNTLTTETAASANSVDVVLL